MFVVVIEDSKKIKDGDCGIKLYKDLEDAKNWADKLVLNIIDEGMTIDEYVDTQEDATYWRNGYNTKGFERAYLYQNKLTSISIKEYEEY
jgi:hypothetical protein